MKIRCMGCMEEYEASYDLCPYCGYDTNKDNDNPIYIQPGAVLQEKYLIGSVQRHRGFEIIYIAWDLILDHKVVVKEYFPDSLAIRLTGQAQVSVFDGKKRELFVYGMEQFEENARKLARFQKEKGIVNIYDYFAQNDTAYVVLEHLEGERLSVYQEKSGKISFDEAVSILTPVMELMIAMHKLGIIHNEIIPSEIIVTKEGYGKLLNTGSSLQYGKQMRRPVVPIVNSGYAALELYESQSSLGPYTDVYSIAAVLYHMITGCKPEESVNRMTLKDFGEKYIIEKLNESQVTRNQEIAILNALNVRMKDRTPTMEIFLKELTSVDSVKPRRHKFHFWNKWKK